MAHINTKEDMKIRNFWCLFYQHLENIISLNSTDNILLLLLLLLYEIILINIEGAWNAFQYDEHGWGWSRSFQADILSTHLFSTGYVSGEQNRDEPNWHAEIFRTLYGRIFPPLSSALILFCLLLNLFIFFPFSLFASYMYVFC